MTIDLAGSTALVTGGNRGIGLAAVRALAEAGAAVTFTARNSQAIETARSALGEQLDARGVVCDVTDQAGMTRIVEEGFDILINNAGVISPIGRICETSIDDWAHNIQVNLISAYHVATLAIDKMLPRGGGTIINLSSGAAHAPMEGWSAYCAGKAGLAMVTRCIHEELGDRGIRVFGFKPGVVDTGMQASIRASGINVVSKLRREDLASVDEPAHAMVWLCTSAADGRVGQELDIRDQAFRRECGLPATG